jgi:hypothetical protein
MTSRRIEFAIPLVEVVGGIDSTSMLAEMLAIFGNRTGDTVCVAWAQEPTKVQETVIRTAGGELFGDAASDTPSGATSDSAWTIGGWVIALIVVMLIIVFGLPLVFYALSGEPGSDRTNLPSQH